MDAYIIAGFRSAVGKAPRGKFRFTRPDDLAANVIKHLMASVPNLIPDKARRDALEASGNAIHASVLQLTKAYVARVLSILQLSIVSIGSLPESAEAL